VSSEELATAVSSSREAIAKDPSNHGAYIPLYVAQYSNSWGIRGDNTPQNAKYLGYLDARELYPDFQPAKLEDYVSDLLQGMAKKVYAGKTW